MAIYKDWEKIICIPLKSQDLLSKTQLDSSTSSNLTRRHKWSSLFQKSYFNINRLTDNSAKYKDVRMCDLEVPPSYFVKTCKIIYSDEIGIYLCRVHRISSPNATTKYHWSAVCNKFSICIGGLKSNSSNMLKEESRRNKRGYHFARWS